MDKALARFVVVQEPNATFNIYKICLIFVVSVIPYFVVAKFKVLSL